MPITGPAITPAQIVAAISAGIPILGQLLAAFGIYSLSPAEQDALTNALNWAVPFAMALIGGDAALRASRNHATAKIQAAGQTPEEPEPADVPAP